jgi:hypothetical protein
MIETFVVLAGLVMAAVAVAIAIAVVVAVVVAIALVVKLVLGLVLLPLGLLAGEPVTATLLVGGAVLAGVAFLAFAVFLPLVGTALLALAPVALVAGVVVLALRAKTVPAPASLPPAQGRLEG